MQAINDFLSRKLFEVNGFTLTIGMVVAVLIIILVWRRIR